MSELSCLKSVEFRLHTIQFPSRNIKRSLPVFSAGPASWSTVTLLEVGFLCDPEPFDCVPCLRVSFLPFQAFVVMLCLYIADERWHF